MNIDRLVDDYLRRLHAEQQPCRRRGGPSWLPKSVSISTRPCKMLARATR
jgi:hypothetical protein